MSRELFVKQLVAGRATLEAELAGITADPSAPESVRQRAMRAADALDGAFAGIKEAAGDGGGSPSGRVILAGSATVKGPASHYKTARTSAVHVKSGQPVCPACFDGRAAENGSEYELAKIGSLLKMHARRCPGLAPFVSWDEHDQQFLTASIHEDAWCGMVGGQWDRGIRGERTKAILSDSTSGGSYLNPEFFDDLAITYPLLTGELLPFVELVNVPRAAAVEGASVSTPTATWGTAEGSEHGLFSTSAMIAQTSHSIFPIGVFVEVGRDVLADSAIALGQLLVQLIGQRFAAELDKVIAVGDGTTQPQGIFNASGVNSLSAANGTAGPLTVGDIESLIFGVGKQYRISAFAPDFVTTDEGYRRARAVPVGTTDARRVFGMTHSNCQLLEYPARINNDIPEGSFAFCCLRKYRLYRRLGMQIQWSDSGETLMRKNTALLAVRGRFGGFLTDGNACAKFTNGPTTG